MRRFFTRWVFIFSGAVGLGSSGFAESGGDMVAISAIVESIDPDGSSQVIAEPKLVVPIGKWATFHDGGEMTFPSEFTLPNIPEELAGSARIDGSAEGGERWETNTKGLVIPSHPKAFKVHHHGLTIKFRPRLNENGKLIVDCETEEKSFAGFKNSNNPITVTKEGLGGKDKRSTLTQNVREVPEFRTRTQELVFLPATSGLVPKVLAESVVPRENEASTAKFQVSLSASRIKKEKPPKKTSPPKKPAIFLSIKAIESSTEEVAGKVVSGNVAPGLPVLTDSEFQMWIRKLNQQKGVDLLSAPSVLLRPGQKGKVEVVREFIYPVAYDPPVFSTKGDSETAQEKKNNGKGFGFPVTPSAPREFKTTETGVTLEVLARILSDGRIELELEPGVKEFEKFFNFGKSIVFLDKNGLGKTREIVISENRMEVPSFQKRSVETTVRIPEGSTVVVGGLIREDIQDVEDKVPVLGDLPLIGRFARSQTELHLKRYLYFSVTAKLVDEADSKSN